MHAALLVIVATSIAIRQQPSALREGVAALNAGDPEKAVSLLQQVVEQRPDSKLALLHLANAQLAGPPPTSPQEAQQRAERAARTLQQVLQIDPDDKLALWNLAMLRGFQQGLPYLQRLVAIDPSYPDSLSALGTFQTMNALAALREALRAAGTPAEDDEWIADVAAREAVRRAAGGALEDAERTVKRGRAARPDDYVPLVVHNMLLTWRARLADTEVESMRYREEAVRLRQRAALLRPPPPKSPNQRPALDPDRPPPPLPGPGTPPPPPPRRMA